MTVFRVNAARSFSELPIRGALSTSMLASRDALWHSEGNDAMADSQEASAGAAWFLFGRTYHVALV
jgi:hypothetical protein